MAILAGIGYLQSKVLDPVVRDPAVHVRLLVAIPLLFLAEALLEERSGASFRLLVEGYVRQKGDATPIARGAERLRDSALLEVAILALAVGLSQYVFWGGSGSSGVFHSVRLSRLHSAPFIWYGLVGLPVYQFLLGRMLYRWGIWSRVLFSLSRLELDPVSTHPDRAAGLGCVAEPVPAFAAVVLANSAVIAASWGYEMVASGVELKAFGPGYVASVVGAMTLALGPMLAFSRTLLWARIRGLRQYQTLALRYDRLFHQRWIIEEDDTCLLGTSDIQSLADLGTSYERLESARIVPFGPRSVVIVFVATFLPVVPLLAVNQPVDQLIAKLARTVLGGLPP
jgi:hypothetical protein